MSRRLALAIGTLGVLLSCTACGGNDVATGASPGSAPTGSPSSASSPTPAGTPAGTPTTAGARGGSSQFCTTARRLGLDTVQVEDAGNADVSQLLAGLDTLASLASPDLEPDFDRFVGLERAVIDPAGAPTGAAGNLDDPDKLTALGHVERYLQDTCGLAR